MKDRQPTPLTGEIVIAEIEDFRDKFKPDEWGKTWREKFFNNFCLLFYVESPLSPARIQTPRDQQLYADFKSAASEWI